MRECAKSARLLRAYSPTRNDDARTVCRGEKAAMASAGGAVSLESRTEINVSGASSPDEVARRVAVEQDNINADLIRYAQGAAR